jgi:hypothetical protein
MYRNSIRTFLYVNNFKCSDGVYQIYTYKFSINIFRVKNFKHRCGTNLWCYFVRTFVSVCLLVVIMRISGPLSFVICSYY